jgi:hypothetical protein
MEINLCAKRKEQLKQYVQVEDAVVNLHCTLFLRRAKNN